MKRFIICFLLSAGFGLACAMIARGEIVTMLKNAISLCLESIGIH